MRKILVVLWVLSGITLAQEEDACPAIIEMALTNTGDLCGDTGRNQACYGHIAMSAESQPDVNDFDFSATGDIVDVAAIRSLRLSSLNIDAGEWGVAFFRIQANLPDTLPGQNVTFMLFGDTEITNAAQSVAEQTPTLLDVNVTASVNVNVRVGPGTDRAVITSLPPGQILTATGRLADNSWLRIRLPDSENTGWVFSELLNSADDEIDTLKIVEASAAEYGPMQAFYLSTGIGEARCREAPNDGIMVQTPEGAGSINLMVNEVEIELGSTVVRANFWTQQKRV